MDYIDISTLDTLRGELIDSFYLIRAHNVRQSKSGKDYIDLVLADAGAEVPGKIWDVDPFRRSLKAGEIVKIRAMVEEFMGATQLNVKIIRLPGDTDDVDERCLIPSAPEEGETLYKTAIGYAGKIKRTQLMDFVKTLYETRKEKLVTAPGAVQMHHSVRAGLLWHTVTMLRAAEALLPVYPGLDADLLYAGILLH
ncbi:MAG: CMP-binding protein, partial [Clostridia bacterium]|nr:CMP-binding protein [Clostridia bacterium]